MTDAAFSITKAAITVTVAGTASSSTYTGEAQTGTVAYELSSSDALYDASKVQFSGDATVSGTTVGDYPYGLAAADFAYDDANIDATFNVTDAAFSITPASITIAVIGYTGTYDGAAHEPTVTVDPYDATVLWSTDGGTNWSATVPSVTGVTNVSVVAKAEKANYTTVTSEVAALTVTAKALTIKADDIIVPVHTSTNAIPFTFSYSGFVEGETNTVLAAQPTATAVGYSADSLTNTTYEIVPSGAVASNYEIVYENGTLTVGPAEAPTMLATVSIAVDGMLKRHLSTETVETLLRKELMPEATNGEKKSPFDFIRGMKHD